MFEDAMTSAFLQHEIADFQTKSQQDLHQLIWWLGTEQKNGSSGKTRIRVRT
jgi:hypothetical protein